MVRVLEGWWLLVLGFGCYVVDLEFLRALYDDACPAFERSRRRDFFYLLFWFFLFRFFFF